MASRKGDETHISKADLELNPLINFSLLQKMIEGSFTSDPAFIGETNMQSVTKDLISIQFKKHVEPQGLKSLLME